MHTLVASIRRVFGGFGCVPYTLGVGVCEVEGERQRVLREGEKTGSACVCDCVAQHNPHHPSKSLTTKIQIPKV